MSNIILIGFMGCGKTTFGKWIARRYEMNFCDTDAYIEKNEKKTINEIFAEHGEEYFRDLETECLRKMCGELDNTVLSVGGGLPLRKENAELLKKIGKVVYLRAGVDELVRRLESDKTRPLLAQGDIREKITSLMSARQDCYIAASDVVVDTDNRQFEEMYEDICAE
jgi:shikimate kinase